VEPESKSGGAFMVVCGVPLGMCGNIRETLGNHWGVIGGAWRRVMT